MLRRISLSLLLLLPLAACTEGGGSATPDMSPEKEDMSVVGDMSAEMLDADMGEPPIGDMALVSEDMSSPPEDMSARDPVPDPSVYASCAPYAVRGEFEVGVTTLMLDGVPVEVWYPAKMAGEALQAPRRRPVSTSDCTADSSAPHLTSGALDHVHQR